MAKMIGENKKVLEIGCANGYFGKHLIQNQRCKVVGVELDAQAACEARAIYEQVVTGDISRKETLDQIIPPQEKFDVILCSNVLEHLMDPLEVLGRLKNLLHPTGYFVIALPNIAHWSVCLKLLFGKFEYTDAGGICDSGHIKFSVNTVTPNSGLQISTAGLFWGFVVRC